MKLFFSLLFFVPSVGLANLTTGEDFVVEDHSRRVVPNNLGTNGGGFNQNTNGQGSTTASPSDDVSSESDAGGNTDEVGSTSNLNTGGLQALDSANSANSQGKAVQMLGLAMGAGFAATCASGPQNTWACPLAAKSFMDAASAGQTAGNAAYTGAHLDPNAFNMDFANPNFNFDDPYQVQAADGLQQMAALGYTPNPDGSVTLPDGSKINPGEFGTAESLSNMGLTPEQQAKAMSQIASVKDSAAKKAGVDAEQMAEGDLAATGGNKGGGLGDGAGEAFASSSPGGDEVVETIEYRGRKKKKNKRMPASVAADLSKNFNGTPIGIGMADLFLIVHKKYNEKNKKRTEFINKEY